MIYLVLFTRGSGCEWSHVGNQMFKVLAAQTMKRYYKILWEEKTNPVIELLVSTWLYEMGNIMKWADAMP